MLGSMQPLASVPNQNTVTLRDDYIEVVWDGPQEAEKVRGSNADTQAAAAQLQAEHKPVRLLLYIQHHPLMANIGGFMEVLKVFRMVPFDRVVICGTLPGPVMQLTTVIISSFHAEFDIKYIADQEAALVWLRRPA